jgi:cell division protease FtsH
MQQTIDEEVRRLVDDAHADVTQLLTEHRDQLLSLAEALLEAETLDAAEAYAAAGVAPKPPQLEQPPAEQPPAEQPPAEQPPAAGIAAGS